MDESTADTMVPDPASELTPELPVLDADAAIPVTIEPASTSDLPVIQVSPDAALTSQIPGARFAR